MFEFVSPALREGDLEGAEGSKVSATSVGSGVRIEEQELKLTRVHLVDSCCKILQVS